MFMQAGTLSDAEIAIDLLQKNMKGIATLCKFYCLLRKGGLY